MVEGTRERERNLREGSILETLLKKKVYSKDNFLFICGFLNCTSSWCKQENVCCTCERIEKYREKRNRREMKGKNSI